MFLNQKARKFSRSGLEHMKWDDAALKEIPVGGFASAAPQMRHYAQCKGDGIVQVNGIAPFVVNFALGQITPALQKRGISSSPGRASPVGQIGNNPTRIKSNGEVPASLTKSAL
jgi:hypothetical protein